MAFSWRVSEFKRPPLALFLLQFFVLQGGAACFLWAGFGGPDVQHWRYAALGALFGLMSALTVLNYVWPRLKDGRRSARPLSAVDNVSSHARGADTGA